MKHAGRLAKLAGSGLFAGVLAGCLSLSGANVPPLPERETAPAGACTATDITPAVIETVTEDILLEPAQVDEQGNVITAPVFETRTRQTIVQERREVAFETPCPPVFTPEFIASLQRALKARGHYRAEITGRMDTTTMEAIRSYQRGFGLNSAILSSDAARRLGLLVADPT